VWTNLRVIADQAGADDIPHHYIGVGRPRPYPEPVAKDVDVVALADNRWTALAHEAIAGLRPGVTTSLLPSLPHEELLQGLGLGRILVHPARIEGRSRLCEEARAMGTVPVMLTSNRIAEGADAASGGVSVSDIADVVPAVHALLDDPTRLQTLAEVGSTAARGVGEWAPFVARVARALAEPDAEVARFADGRVAVGARLMSREQAAIERGRGTATLESATTAQADALRHELSESIRREQELQGTLAVEHQRYQRLRNRRIVRAALRIASVRERLRALRRR
jgi:hypothetical protein